MEILEREPGSSRKKLDSYAAAMEFDEVWQFRAIVYARLLRSMMDEFGEDVLDIAEEWRRESGRYAGELMVDIAENEKKYEADPGLLIEDIHAYFEGHPCDWSRTCRCVYNSLPEKRRHENLILRCTYGEAFRKIKEEKTGISWCCFDMGFVTAFHPLFYQYMPRHLLKGDGMCQQIRGLAETPEEQQKMNSIGTTGWRSWK